MKGAGITQVGLMLSVRVDRIDASWLWVEIRLELLS